jgi:hypothetical protein
MNHDSYQFDFPGRGYRFHHASITHAAEVDALRAIAAILEPAVVEALDEQHSVFHLVVDEERGGAYRREPSRTRQLVQIDEIGLISWFDEVTKRGAQPLEELSIFDGWFSVSANAGDILRLYTQDSRDDVEIIERRGRSVVRAPNQTVIVAPFTIRLLSQTSWLEIAMHWSAWANSSGVGRMYFQQLIDALTGCGWVLAAQPNPEDLAWPHSSARR